MLNKKLLIFGLTFFTINIIIRISIYKEAITLKSVILNIFSAIVAMLIIYYFEKKKSKQN